jgi:hypothetical protein
VGWLKIEAVDVIELRRLRESDARADGFENVAQMTRMLRQLYPGHARDGRQWFRVAFSREGDQSSA